jgi:hypothetical protein
MTFRKKLLVAALLLPVCGTGIQAAEEAPPIAAAVAASEATAPVVDEKADVVLRQMSEFLAKQGQFRVHTSRSLDLVLDNGQKIQADSAADVTLKRPDGLRVERKGVKVDQSLYYNGKELAISRSNGVFATTEAPPTIDEFLDQAIDTLGLVPPGADLLYSDPYKVLTEDRLAADYLGVALIDGMRCHHLAFRNRGVDWQIWVEEGERPLPRKLVVTSTTEAEAPQFIAWYSKWDLAPQIAADEFTFTPPANAVKVGITSPEATAN